MKNTIKCKNCGVEIEITEAIVHELREEIERDILVKERAKNEQETEKLREKLKLAENAELELRKAKNQLEEEKRSFEIEKQRQIDAERQQIRKKTLEEFSETQRLKDKEKDETIESLRRALEDAQRKASQRSQQLQGEVQELDLEEKLQRLFPTDEITEVKKGELGADVRHIVKTSRGTICGVILWESKRTKAWSDGWITKLKEDARNDKAHVAALVSEVLPEDMRKGIGSRDGVWIAEPGLVEPLALLLRKSLIDVAREKVVASNKQSKAGELYDFVTSREFTEQLERMIEIYLDMKSQVTRERVSMERSLKQREVQIDRLLTGVSGIYGSMQGIAGSALPQIKSLQSGVDLEGSEK